ncbi:aryl-alcohol oxidase-like protein [Mycena capillaripes]|nr:aryl-alcohol oxidase-like protein [Mycena capillaripes]
MAWLSSLLLLAPLCSGVILNDFADLNKLNLQYDFIVVGAGTAGNVVANRLSENPAHSVLVLEAGALPDPVLDAVPFFGTRTIPRTAQNWNYTTTSQPGLNNRSIAYPRGFVLGGCSGINFMVYNRGAKEDFNRWASVTKDDGWSWNKLLPYIIKNENFTQPADHHNTAGQFDPAVHGFNGPLSVTLAGFPTPIDPRVIATTSQLKEFPFNLDMNSGSTLGVGWQQATILNGARASSATAYLTPQFVARPNLHVLLNARVTRVLPTSSNAFRTVEFVQDLNGTRFTMTATKEMVLSAGAIGTPSILMHSGIGESSALTNLGIKPLHNLPSVGRNLSDHPILFFSFFVNSTDTYETPERNATLAAQRLAQWKSSRTGQDVDNPVTHLAWLRVPASSRSTVFKNSPDVSSSPNTPHYEFLISNGELGDVPATGNFLGITPAVVSPASRGSVTLNSNDALAAPVINPNLLGEEVDRLIMREAIKSAMRFAQAPAWKGYVISPSGLNFTSTDADIDTFVRAKTGTIFHPVGTASMSPTDASWGVVDPDLTVKGLTGLRIVDLSITPFIPAAHPQSAAYFIGERASDLIKAAWH